MALLRFLAVISLAVAGLDAHGKEPVTIRIDDPIGGWSLPVTSDARFLQPVGYPASSVTLAAEQAPGARVTGTIAGITGVATLVVNGLGMPVRIGEDGRFGRPMRFPYGSNGVSVRAGQATRAVQFYGLPGGAAPPRLRVVLSWDSDGTDLDLHVVTPDGAHAWYGQRVLANGGALDVDVTTGYGPEIFATPTPLPGTYLVYVNYFGGGFDGEDPAQELTVATIGILQGEGTTAEKLESFRIPMREPGELVLARRFSMP